MKKLTEDQIVENLAVYRQIMETHSDEGIQHFDGEHWVHPRLDCELHATHLYRRQPAPIVRPWKINEVPLNHWFKAKGSPWATKIFAFSDTALIFTPGGQHIDFQRLFDQWEHSDEGLAWHPCGVTE